MCQVGEDYGAPAPEMPPPPPPPRAGRELKCVKCKEGLPVVVIRAGDAFCRDCFKAFYVHKFRAVLGKNRLIFPGEKVLLAWSGGPSSSSMIWQVLEGLSRDSAKRLRFVPGVVYIDEGAACGQSLEDRAKTLAEMKLILQTVGFPWHIVALEEVFSLPPSVLRYLAQEPSETKGAYKAAVDSFLQQQHAPAEAEEQLSQPGSQDPPSPAGLPIAARTKTQPPTDAQTEAQPPTAAQTEAQTPTAAQTEAQPPTAAQTEAQPPTAAQTETQTPTAAQTEAQPPTAAQTEAQTPTAAQTEAQPPTAAQTETQTPTAAQTEAQPPTAAQTEAQPPTAAQTEAQPPTAAQTEAQPPTAAQTEAQPPSAAQTEALSRLFNSVKTLTAKEELLQTLRTHLILHVARTHGYSKVMTGDSCTRLAIKLMTSLALGRGAFLAWDTGFSDERHGDVVVVRPMREHTLKEVAFYNRLFAVPSVFTPAIDTKAPEKSSIHRLMEAFMLRLQAQFPSTVSTVYRTSEKLVKAPRDGSAGGPPGPRCLLCMCALDIDTADSATAFGAQTSHLSQMQPPTPPAEAPTTPCCSAGVGGAQGCCCGTELCGREDPRARVIEQLCYGCRVNMKDLPSLDPLPPYILTEAQLRSQRASVLKEMQEYLIDSDDEAQTGES